jgi:hypothetical protein
MELQQPKSVISLATSAVLVSVDVNVWSATKQDRGISDEVTNSKNADNSAGRFVKNLLADDNYHKKVANYRQTVYNWLKRNTFRWNNSQDLLPSMQIEQFKTEYQEHETEFYRLLDDFLLNYTAIVSDMAFKQGDMFNREDYPSVDQVRSKFGIRLYVAEVPSHDFRCAVSADIAEDLKQQYEVQANEVITGIMGQQVEQLVEVMQSISHCCGYAENTNPQTGEVVSKKRKIYDTTIEKAKNMCNLYRQFNLANDQKITEAVVMLDMCLKNVSAELIRDSDAVRARVQDDVDDILSKFSF